MNNILTAIKRELMDTATKPRKRYVKHLLTHPVELLRRVVYFLFGQTVGRVVYVRGGVISSFPSGSSVLSRKDTSGCGDAFGNKKLEELEETKMQRGQSVGIAIVYCRRTSVFTQTT